MQNWIAGLLAVLGTLLVLAGGTVTTLHALSQTPATAVPEPTGAKPSLLGRLRHLGGADRLVFWGVLLLVIAAIAAGAISFNIGASAGTR